MDTSNIIALASVLTITLGMVAAAWFNMLTVVNAMRAELNARVDRVVERAQSDVDGVRQEVETVRYQYVRRDDLDAHMRRIEAQQDNINKKLDEISTALRHRSTNLEQRVALLEAFTVKPRLAQSILKTDMEESK